MLKLKFNLENLWKKSNALNEDLNIFGIVDVSKSFRPGYLNTQTIMLIESVGVSEKKFISLKDEIYFNSTKWKLEKRKFENMKLGGFLN